MTVEIVKTWTGKSGATVTVTGKLITETVNYCDGDNIITPCCELYVNVNVEGKGDMGGVVEELNAQMKAANPGYTHKVGKLALSAENAEIVKSVWAELKGQPEWIAKQAVIDANDNARREDYEQKKANGFCFKCGSDCYGDCEA